jgi:hypothetical protein
VLVTATPLIVLTDVITLVVIPPVEFDVFDGLVVIDPGVLVDEPPLGRQPVNTFVQKVSGCVATTRDTSNL